MKVHRSARKHGVLLEHAIRAADLALWIEPLEEEEWPHRDLRLGFDTQARLLETVVLIFRSGEEMVIHAMPARPQFLGPPALSKRTGLPLAGRRGLAAGCGVCSA